MKIFCLSSGAFLLLSLVVAISPQVSDAATKKKKLLVCVTTKGQFIVRETRCRKGETQGGTSNIQGVQGVQGPQGQQGPQGIQGAPGQNGSLRIYGDGSSGNFVSPAGISTFDPESPLFNNFTVLPGAIVNVSSGTIIRCNGNFLNQGIINVDFYARGGSILDQDKIIPRFRPPVAGIAGSVSTNGTFGNNSEMISGGSGGSGLTPEEARQILSPGPLGGGGGGAGGSPGGGGGGTITILCKGSIQNIGIIRANGETPSGSPGGGGGAGGVVIVASPTSISNTGSLEAKGGNGASGTTIGGASGGGGGGIVHLISPVIAAIGTINIPGGTAGNQGVTVTANPRSAGGGGGGSGGTGGIGADISAAGTQSGTTAGGVGEFIQTPVDPTSLF